MFLRWGLVFAGLVILTSSPYPSELLVPGRGFICLQDFVMCACAPSFSLRFRQQTTVYTSPEGHENTADVKRVQVGWHLIPHTNDTLPLILTNFQLQAEYGNTFSCQHDKVRDQECICTKLNSGILQHVLHSSLHDMQMTVYQLFSSLIFQLCWRM